MSTYTENYGLTMPSDEDYYNVEVYNENLSTLDSELASTSAEIESVSEKIGNPYDTGSETLFGKLNNNASFIKSMQTVVVDGTSNGVTHTRTLETAVTPSKCLVITDRYGDSTGGNTILKTTLNEDTFTCNMTHENGEFNVAVRFWILEFY